MDDAALSVEDVMRLIAAGEEPTLVGTFETADLDFKGQLRLVDGRDRWELAKDIAAFANRGGGLIAVGFITELDNDRAEEVVTAVKAFPPELFDPKQIHDVAERWVYPPPVVSVVRHPRSEGALGTIRVDSVADDMPHLVTRMPDDIGRLPEQVAFGWPRRSGTHTTWTPIGQLHRHLRSNGRPPTQTARARPVEPNADVNQLVDDIETSMGWNDRAIVYLVAEPSEQQPIPIPGFYAEDGVLGAVERPFELRYAGFGITYGHQIETDDAGRIISNDDERALVVRPDGIAIAALAATPHFLTRGGGADRTAQPETRDINPVVVTEWTYLFCHFVAEKLAQNVDTDWRITMGLRGAKTRPWSLSASPGRWTDKGRVWFRRGTLSQMDRWQHTIEASLDAGRDAYVLLQALYSVFGLGFDDVELANGEQIDPDLIRSLS